MKKAKEQASYPGVFTTADGSSAVIAMETAASEAAGSHPITPSSRMEEGWASAAETGKKNVNGRNLLFFQAEGEHAAAGVTAGMSMVGMRSTNFSSGQGIAYMHESMYAAVGKRLTYVLNVACRAMTKHALSVHAGHDDYHAVDDTGFFQLFAKDVQSVADLNLIAHRIAEQSLNPGICAQDGFLTSHVIESYLQPERELIRQYLGDPADVIETPTAAQRAVFGDTRRRIPELYDFDYPSMLGVTQNQDSYAQGVAAQRPFYFDHIPELTDQAFAEFEALTGRHYRRVLGYRMRDAEYVIVGQGSVIGNAEVVAEHLRKTRGLKVGVIDLVMFRPFPADLISTLLAGKKAVLVLERTDQPLAVDLPMLREIRSAMSQAVENGRADDSDSSKVLPYADVASIDADEVPDFYSGCFGLGSRDLQPGDIVAAVENMLEGGRQQRQFYLGFDFIQKNTALPKMQIWQESILADYPRVEHLALQSAGDLNLFPDEAIQLRIHSVGGWDVVGMGKNLSMMTADLLDMHVKAYPKPGSENKGQPTTFSAVLANQPLHLNCALQHLSVVISPDPNILLHTNPLEGLRDGGVFIMQSGLEGKQLWSSFPQFVQRKIRDRNIKVCHIDAFAIALTEDSNAALRFQLQGQVLMGAFLRTASLKGIQDLDREDLLEGLGQQLTRMYGLLDRDEIEHAKRVLVRGFDEVQTLDLASMDDEGDEDTLPLIPGSLAGAKANKGIGNQATFWDQVCSQYKTGRDVLADPFTAISAIPAATANMRDMSAVRLLVPDFIADKCTGCSKCWIQCPDSAIPGVVNTVEEVLQAAVKTVSSPQNPMARFSQTIKNIGKESRKVIAAGTFTTYGEVLAQCYETVADKSNWDTERRAEVDAQYKLVHTSLKDFPLAKTTPFFDLPESKNKGDGGLLSITINPETCKGCDLCVAVCTDGALVSVPQTDAMQDKLEANWKLWKNLPETDDRYIKISSLDEGIGVMPSLLLKQSNYMSMLGGDGACKGCGEKTAIHLVLSAVNAFMAPRVSDHIKNLARLAKSLDEKARKLLIEETDLGSVSADSKDLSVAVDVQKKEYVQLIHKSIEDLKDLKWRYQEGPSGRGRARMGFSNSTGCTSVWGATFPYNPYPFPWVSHLFQDAPSVAVGIFEGHMRKMADGFIAVRRAEKLLADRYDAADDEAYFSDFAWQQFTDDEFFLCPPLFAVGGDGAMLDIGFQNLSRVLASDKPIRVVVVDTQGNSNTGGKSCTAGFSGQVSDRAEYDSGGKGKQEDRKELALLAMAHRGAFVLQSSQATPSHLLENVLKGLQTRRPSIFILNAPCPPEWGFAESGSPDAAKLALESRAVPNLVFNPDLGTTFSECLDLSGNPSPDDTWTQHDLLYVDELGAEQKMTLPLTTADWAFSEARFQQHFYRPDDEEALLPFHQYLALDIDERDDTTAFIYTVDRNKQLGKIAISDEITRLAEERLNFWAQLKELAGVEVSENMRDAVGGGLSREMEAKLKLIQAEYKQKITLLATQYPQLIARRMAEGLLSAAPNDTVAQLLERAENWQGQALTEPDFGDSGTAPTTSKSTADADENMAPAAEIVTDAIDADDDDDMGNEPYIDTLRCTSCDDCLKINVKMFVYNDDQQAYIDHPELGTFKQLVVAAEACPAECIHPGDPLNPKEKGLDKLIKRAEPFN